MANKKFFPNIDYTSRDFASIKKELVDYAKRYYPTTFKDFNEAGFGAMTLDTVSYIGDILSFYLDYSVNESFLNTAVEYNNVLKLGRQMGYRFQGSHSSYGIAAFYVVVPALASGLGPDTRYMPILKRNSEFTSLAGNGYVLNEDINFADADNEVVVARVNEANGNPTHYAVKAYGQVISGKLVEEIIDIGILKKFLRLPLQTENITEIVSVEDREGHEYFKVDYLTQDVIYKAATNRGANATTTPSLLKPFIVPRRFTVERETEKTYLQFGFGSDRDTTSDPLIDPSTVILNVHGRDYVVDPSFDPANMLGTDKLGIVPSNTRLSVVARVNELDDVNAASDTITQVNRAILIFDDVTSLDTASVRDVKSSVEVNNEEAILGDVTLPTVEELKLRMYDVFASQARAVTAQDYKSLCYSMPPEFGAVKRINIVQDPDSFKRNLNLYIVSENTDGTLVAANSSIKSNLKTWINRNRMVNDTIDILDAIIVNIGINFVVFGDEQVNRYLVLERCVNALQLKFFQKFDIGEAFSISEIYKTLNAVDGVVDTLSVEIEQRIGSNYSGASFDLDSRTTPDGRWIDVPRNVIMEVKYTDNDIKGSVK